MKNHPVFPAIPLVAALVFSSCQRPADEGSAGNQAEEERAAVQAAADALEAERARVRAEREVLEAEKEELRLQREAAMEAKEQELAGLEAELGAQSEEARLAAEALAAEQAELDRREQELNQIELEQAGTTVIADWTAEEPALVQEPVADYSLFYDELEPYGDWFETPDYGYVYQPTVVIQNRSWRPYTLGRWVCSNLGWTWRSDEPFGWATFHYGRWALLSGRGWCWVPGSEWAPSWCAWREGGGHVGWAPLPPETLAYRGRGWGANVDVELGISSSWFNFVENRHMASPLARHCLPVSRNRHFFSSTRGCTNIQFQQNRIISGGPSYAALNKAVGQPWPVCLLDLDSVSGIGRGKGRQDHRNGVRHGNRLRLFAPSVDAPWNPGLRPDRVADRWKDVDVVRAENGLQQTWSRRLAEARERQQESAQRWTRNNRDENEARERQLQQNREKVAAAQARSRDELERQIEQRERRVAESRSHAGRRTAADSDRDRIAAGRTRGGNGPSLPPGVSRGQVTPPSEIAPVDSPGATRTPANDRMAEIRRQQEEARERTAQRAEEARAQAEELRNARNNPAGSGRGGNATASPPNARMDQSRLQRGQSARQAQMRQQQEQARLRQEAQGRQQEQQERVRAAQAQAEQAQAERVRQQQEQVRERAAADQQAAEQAARERQAAEQRVAAQRAAQQQAQQQENNRRQEEARRAVQERARQAQERAREVAEQRARQQENARRQEEARRAAQERARQEQDRAREAAEQRARQQENARRQEEARRAAQDRARQAQERAREAAEQRARQQEQNRQRNR